MSDLTSFNTYKSAGGYVVAIDPTTPITGSGSLRFLVNGAGSGRINMVRSQGQRAFTSGRVRFLADWVGNTTDTKIGVAFQQSQEDISGATGTAYFFCVRINTSGNHKLSVFQCTGGLTTQSLLFESTGTFPLVSRIAAELTWTLDIANLGGINFYARRGVALDFSDLVVEPGLDNKISTTSVLTSTVGEGPACVLSASATQYRLDSIRCNRIIIGG